MKYGYSDRGEQRQQSQVVVHLHGMPADVILLDSPNFDRYRFGQPFGYSGGLYTRRSHRLGIPQDGRWYLAIDCGGYRHHVHAKKIEIQPREEPPNALRM